MRADDRRDSCDCDPVEVVERDVVDGIGGAFPPSSGFRVQEGFGDETIGSSRHTVVAWEYEGTHDAPFAGVAPTGLPVHLKGLTVIEHLGGERHLLHRYVDWVTVMAQLGMSASFRPAVPELPDRRAAGEAADPD